MSESKANDVELMDSVIRELGAAARSRRLSHPAPDALIDFSRGELDETAAEKIRSHLEICPDCTRTVLDLGELSRFEAASEDPSAEEVALRFQELSARLSSRPGSEDGPRLEPEDSSASVVELGASRRAAPRRWESRLAWAAALLAAMLSSFLAGWIFFGGEDEVPRPNVHVASLAPDAESAVREPSASRLRIPAVAESFVLLLNLPDLREYPRYRLEVFEAAEAGADATSEPVWLDESLRRGVAGNFTVELPRTFLSPGSYRLRLSGLGGKGEIVVLARYGFELIYE